MTEKEEKNNSHDNYGFTKQGIHSTLLTTHQPIPNQALNSSHSSANSPRFHSFFSHDVMWYGISLWQV